MAGRPTLEAPHRVGLMPKTARQEAVSDEGKGGCQSSTIKVYSPRHHFRLSLSRSSEGNMHPFKLRTEAQSLRAKMGRAPNSCGGIGDRTGALVLAAAMSSRRFLKPFDGDTTKTLDRLPSGMTPEKSRVSYGAFG